MILNLKNRKSLHASSICRLRLNRTYTFYCAVTPLAMLRHSLVIVYAYVPSVTILRLNNLSILSISKCSDDAKSFKVIVTSSSDRWKLLVFSYHLSTKADISPQSSVSSEHVIKGLNLVITTKPSIFRASREISQPFFHGKITSA